MNKNQVKESASKKDKKVAGDKRTEQTGNAKEHGGKDGAVLKELNSDAKKEKK
ncbi:hypothetical protein [Halomonas rhizosphaerae]|uniref:CsbD family protein n=1 Tax=Halomonas rhizosphaerae TaxID=3043296 RepID=A0ABT6UZY8_9GAMM|nr:hypothetical protein [Halomonas rhizosphaerae]MDI5891541.1 hypothetical protein [Halomonas rhizosphaerae]MDI5919854.1 hypothetical protein [Halomonas rhizosphaerae]